MVSLSHLLEIFAEVVSRKEERTDKVRKDFGEMPRDRFTVTEKVLHIRQTLGQFGRLSLKTLFTNCRSKNEMVVTFLALLEMVRQGETVIRQTQSFSDVEVLPAA